MPAIAKIRKPQGPVGQPMKRKEDPRLVRGISHYTDDFHPAGECRMAVLRSPYAHARITRIDTSMAKRLPGVLAVITGKDIAGKLGPIPCAADIPDMKRPVFTLLATDRVRFVGHPVAAVVAEDQYIAKDALDLIEVDYDPLPAVVDPEKAIEPGATKLYDEFADNVSFLYKLESGDVAGAFKKAQKVIKQRIVNQRLAPVSMETRSVMAEWLPGEGTLTVHSATQIPHLLRTQIGGMTGVPETKIQVIAPEVGGGFGCKLNVYPEEGLAPYLAMQLGRIVKWSEGRRENMQCTIHGRDQINDVEVAIKNDGTILGLKLHVIADLGAYNQLLTPLIPTLTALMALGCYKIPAVLVTITGVFTNKMATDAYRGAGRPEATYMIERVADLVAAEVGKDPVEVRRRNFPQPKEFPFTSATGVVYDSANYQASLKKALEMSGYEKLRKTQAAQRKRIAAGDWPEKILGIGLSTYVEICAMGPSAAMPAGGWESSTVRIEPTAKVTVLTGASPHGQGQETTFAQIVGQQFTISPEDVNVVHGDTNRVPYGIGTFGSRGTAVGGSAMFFAVQKLKEKMKRIAAHILSCQPEDLTFEAGRLQHKKQPKKSLAFGEVVGAAYVAKNLPVGMEPGLDATHFFEPSNFTFPFGAHVCVVEIDSETGDVKIVKYIAVDDCGNIINPLLVRGQVHGGIAQGLGQAMYEEVVYDENGQLLTGSLMDYAVPRAEQLPHFTTDHTCTPSPVNPMGVKGVGEAGTIGSTPALVNAVVDGLAPFGVRHMDMPIKPEKVWRVLQNTRKMQPPMNADGRR
jgi:carbon-monoxide dehydrogenase large subunit